MCSENEIWYFIIEEMTHEEKCKLGTELEIHLNGFRTLATLPINMAGVLKKKLQSTKKKMKLECMHAYLNEDGLCNKEKIEMELRSNLVKANFVIVGLMLTREKENIEFAKKIFDKYKEYIKQSNSKTDSQKNIKEKEIDKDKEYRMEIEKNYKDIAKLRKEKSEFKKENVILKEKLEIKKNAIVTLKKSFQNLINEKEKLQEDNFLLQENIENMNKKIKVLQNEIEDNRNKIIEANKQVNNCNLEKLYYGKVLWVMNNGFLHNNLNYIRRININFDLDEVDNILNSLSGATELLYIDTEIQGYLILKMKRFVTKYCSNIKIKNYSSIDILKQAIEGESI